MVVKKWQGEEGKPTVSVLIVPAHVIEGADAVIQQRPDVHIHAEGEEIVCLDCQEKQDQ